MSKLDQKSFSKDFFKSLKSAEGNLNIKVNDIAKTFPVERAEIRAKDIALYFDMSKGNPDLNSFIGLVISKDALKQKVELPNGDVYLLFQDSAATPPQEWLASSGWVLVECEEGSSRVQGLMSFRSDNDNYAVLQDGKFDVSIGQ
ncbi:hypothetical protein [Pseudomonas sp. CLCA07]